MIDVSSLNENQLNAVKWQTGAMLVLAGPGSGKTRVLTMRIASLIDASPKEHFKILGLTFTNKAASEMRDRIEDMIPYAGERTLLTTFHSFAAELLRQHGHHLGLKPDFTILTQDNDRHSLLEEASLPLGGLQFGMTSEKLLPLITRLIERNIATGASRELLSNGNFENADYLSQVYDNYRSLMIENNSLDFVGLMAETLNLLNQKPAVAKQIRRVYPYVCIDEFQDTNISQYQILRHLINPETQNVFVVADDDQIIYQWNGASPERLKELRSDFDMNVIQLPQNYRCPSDVVLLANNLIAHNFNRTSDKKPLEAQKAQGESVRVFKFDNLDGEVKWIAEDILARVKAEQAKCVILARTKKLLDAALQALQNAGLSGYLGARKNEFVSAPLIWLHASLKLANARSSREHLRLICKAFYSLEGISVDVDEVITLSRTQESDFLRTWIQIVLQRDALSIGARRVIAEALLPLIDRLNFWKFIEVSFEWLDSLPEANPQNPEIFDEYAEEKQTWRSLTGDIVRSFGKDEVTLHLMLQELDLRSKSPDRAVDAIPCFTIHAAKGLEFDHVYLMGLVEDQLPSWLAKKKGDNSKEIQEERRNCFVAITRTQESLTLTYAKKMNGWSKSPSRFLTEMGYQLT